MKQRLLRGDILNGSWLSIGNTITTEIMAQAGFDFLTIDIEHSVIDLHAMQEMIRIIGLYECAPLVRVGENDATLIKRVMDAGAAGVIVPMVNSKADAEKIVEAVKYPPVGQRGVGLARAQGYGFNFAEYQQWLENESVIIAQIEHIKGIENLEDIIAVEGIDGTIIGPYDLSGSLGKPGIFDDPRMLDALFQYEKVSGEAHFPYGAHIVHPDVQKYRDCVNKGYTFLAVGVDMIYLGNSVRNLFTELAKNFRD